MHLHVFQSAFRFPPGQTGQHDLTKNAPQEPAISGRELLQRHLDGDREAFEALVRLYQRELFSFLVRFTGDTSLAEDVFQETFLQLHVSAATFDTSRPLKPWLFTIAANKARDALRSRGRKQGAPLDALVAGSEDQRTRYADLLAGEIPAPDEKLTNMERRQAVEEIVRQMPESLQVVLLLSYFHDLSYNEIAEVLQIPLGTVKSRLHAAVGYFAKQWTAVAQRFGYERKPER